MLQSPLARTATPSMVTRKFGRMVACWHGSETPTDREWGDLLAILRASDLNTVRCFVLTSGGTPSASQRRGIMDVVGVRPLPIAVVSEQVGVRFIASMLAMMTRRIRSFSPAELPAAYAHLELTPDERREAERFVAEMGVPGRRHSHARPSV